MNPPDKPEALANVAHLRGLSGQIMFAMDTKSKPGFAIVHFLRLETMEFEQTKEFDNSIFMVLHPEADPRLLHLAPCFNQAVVQQLVKTNKALELLAVGFQHCLKNPVRTRQMSNGYQDAITLAANVIKENRGRPTEAERVSGATACNVDLGNSNLPTGATCATCGLGPCRKHPPKA